MPLIRIDLNEGKSVEYIRAISAAVHQSIQEYFEVPARDRFQTITEHRPNHLIYDPSYLDIERDDDVVLIQVLFSVGRSAAQKQAFYAGLTELLSKNPGINPRNVIISLVENKREDWSFGNGEAQYLVRPREEWR